MKKKYSKRDWSKQVSEEINLIFIWLVGLTSTYKLASIYITLVALLKPFLEKLKVAKYVCNGPDCSRFQFMEVISYANVIFHGHVVNKATKSSSPIIFSSATDTKEIIMKVYHKQTVFLLQWF